MVYFSGQILDWVHSTYIRAKTNAECVRTSSSRQTQRIDFDVFKVFIPVRPSVCPLLIGRPSVRSKYSDLYSFTFKWSLSNATRRLAILQMLITFYILLTGLVFICKFLTDFKMDYQIIQGIRGGKLLHVLSEDMLYVPKVERNGMQEYVCYQTILCTPKKKNLPNEDRTKCTARVRIRRDGTLQRMTVQHTQHHNHDLIARDMNKRKNMKKKARRLRDDYPQDAHKIPIRHIFQNEIDK